MILLFLSVCRGNGASPEVQELLDTKFRVSGVQSSGRTPPHESGARQLGKDEGHATEGRGVVTDYAKNKPEEKPKPKIAQGAGHDQKLVPLHHEVHDANSTKQTTDGDKPAANDDTKEEANYAPYICGESKEAVEEFCNSDRPICKFVTEQTSGDRPFHITNRLRRNQGDCIRRCDSKYGLSDAHCARGETCIKVPRCTKCALLTSPGCEAF